MRTAGIDIGSITAKAAIVEGERILGTKIIFTGYNAEAAGEKVYKDLLAEIGLDASAVSKIVSTGYGRNSVKFAHRSFTEIMAHAAGAYFLNPKIRTIIDIGGQDSKVIKLSTEGKVEDFSMNDRCAAGTGRFLEVMAKVLELDTGEMASLALRSSRELSISSVCTVFAESEVVSLIGRGEKIEDISAGLFNAIVKRVAAMYARLGSPEPLVFTGGVARNAGVVHAMERVFKRKVILPEVPDIMGAYGAALFATDRQGEKGQ